MYTVDEIYKLLRYYIPSKIYYNQDYYPIIMAIAELITLTLNNADKLPILIDLENVPSDFIGYLFELLGYKNIKYEPDSDFVQRVFLQNFLNILKKRGTERAIVAAIQFASNMKDSDFVKLYSSEIQVKPHPTSGNDWEYMVYYPLGMSLDFSLYPYVKPAGQRDYVTPIGYEDYWARYFERTGILKALADNDYRFTTGMYHKDYYYVNNRTVSFTKVSPIISLDSELDNVKNESEKVIDRQISVGLFGNIVTNVVKNGDFSNGINGWNIWYSTSSVNNNILTLTGDGTNAYFHCAQSGFHSVKINDKLYGRCKVRVSGNPIEIKFYILTPTILEFQVITNPQPDTWYDLSGIVTAIEDDDNVALVVYVLYPDAASANGQTMEVKEVLVLDLTATGLDGKTVNEINEMFPTWFDGTQSAENIRIKLVGKNLFDGELEAGGYMWASGALYNSSDRMRNKNKYIRIKPNTYYVSNKNIAYIWYDENKNFISSDSSYTTNPVMSPANAHYVNIVTSTYYGIDYNLQVALYESDVQITTYEPYQESICYYQLPSGVDSLDSLPNGVGDEIDNTGKLIKRTKKIVLNGSDIDIYYTSLANVDVIQYVMPSDMVTGSDNIDNIAIIIDENGKRRLETDLATRDNTSEIGKFETTAARYINIFVAKGTYVDLADARANFPAQTLIYQLKTPEEYQLDGLTSLYSYEKGTMYVDPYYKKEHTYDSANGGLQFSKALKEIEKVLDGNGNEVDLANVTLSSDGLSATITGASDGETYIVYGYPKEGIIPEVTVSYNIAENKPSGIYTMMARMGYDENSTLIEDYSSKYSEGIIVKPSYMYSEMVDKFTELLSLLRLLFVEVYNSPQESFKGIIYKTVEDSYNKPVVDLTSYKIKGLSERYSKPQVEVVNKVIFNAGSEDFRYETGSEGVLISNDFRANRSRINNRGSYSTRRVKDFVTKL